MEQVGPELVRVTGIRGLPPPPTTKVGITLPGGFQAEWHIWMCGLDIDEKCQITENQIRYAIGKDISRFSKLKFQRMGYSAIDAPNQDIATVDFRIFAQSKDPELLRPDVPNGFNRWVLETFLQSAPVCNLTYLATSSIHKHVFADKVPRGHPSATIFVKWHQSLSTNTGSH